MSEPVVENAFALGDGEADLFEDIGVDLPVGVTVVECVDEGGFACTGDTGGEDHDGLSGLPALGAETVVLGVDFDFERAEYLCDVGGA
nr:hypothetical protein [Brevibacterium sp.]